MSSRAVADLGAGISGHCRQKPRHDTRGNPHKITRGPAAPVAGPRRIDRGGVGRLRWVDRPRPRPNFRGARGPSVSIRSARNVGGRSRHDADRRGSPGQHHAGDAARRGSREDRAGARPGRGRPGADGHPRQPRAPQAGARADGDRHQGQLARSTPNIGNSAVTSDVDNELAKLKMAVGLGSDTVMDLSTGGNIDAIRRAIIAASPVPVGTVPMYQAIQAGQEGRGPDRAGPARRRRAPGQAGGRLHDPARRDLAGLHPPDGAPDHRHRLAGRVSLIAQWMFAHKKENPIYTRFDDFCDIMREYDVTWSLGDSAPARLDRRRLRRRAVRRAEDPGRADPPGQGPRLPGDGRRPRPRADGPDRR